MIGLGISLTKLTASGQASDGADYDNATTALVAAMTTRPSEARIALINALITGLQTDGIWAKTDVLWVLAAADDQAARLNWKTPGSFTASLVGSPVFEADRGYTFDGSTAYLNTTWNASTQGVNYTLNSATIAAWSRTTGQQSGYLFGSGVGATRLAARTAADLSDYRVNNSTSVTTASTDGSGLFSATRSGASATQLYRNGAAFGAAGSGASTSIPGAVFNIGRAVSVVSNAQASIAFAGGALNATEQANAYTRFNTYMTAIGAV